MDLERVETLSRKEFGMSAGRMGFSAHGRGQETVGRLAYDDYTPGL